jgi:TonB family protein
MPLWQQNRTTEIKLSLGEDSAEKQRRQLLVALTLLLAALILTLTKDRGFWFPPSSALQLESEPAEEVLSTRIIQSVPTSTQQEVTGRHNMKLEGSRSADERKPGDASAAVVTSRTALPPMEVEVVAGDERHTIQGSSNSVKMDLQSQTALATAHRSLNQGPANSAAVSDLSGQGHLSSKTAEVVSRSVEPDYPLLAKQMKIQGAVVLEALIGREGSIQHLQVLSGPAILSAAAQQAVRQWRFRPYLVSGQAVETESRITVSFTISTR